MMVLQSRVRCQRGTSAVPVIRKQSLCFAMLFYWFLSYAVSYEQTGGMKNLTDPVGLSSVNYVFRMC
jgi:hypothetical protein